MSYKERYIYLVGDFFAKYHGKRLPQADLSDGAEYKVETYDHRVTNAEFVWDPPLPSPSPRNYMEARTMDAVEIHFSKDPAGYGKPFHEDLRDVIVSEIRLEGVNKEHKRSFGTMRGRMYVRVHTVAE